jgi:hypothetical protein
MDSMPLNANRVITHCSAHYHRMQVSRLRDDENVGVSQLRQGTAVSDERAGATDVSVSWVGVAAQVVTCYA